MDDEFDKLLLDWLQGRSQTAASVGQTSAQSPLRSKPSVYEQGPINPAQMQAAVKYWKSSHGK